MKKLIFTLLIAVLVLPAFAADTLTVDVVEGVNTQLKQIIESNTPGRVIKLKREGVYLCDAEVELLQNTVIVGETSPASKRPAVIAMSTKEDGSPYARMFNGKANLTLKNLYIPGVNIAGAYTNFYLTEATGIRLIVDNCVLNYTNDWQGFFQFKGKNNKAYMTNNIVMNMMRADGYVWATFFHTQGTKHDTLVFTNNTIFNAPNNFMSLNEKEYISPNYALYEHNTIVNTAKDVIHFSYFMNAYRKNNLVVNCIYQGDAEISQAGWTDRVQCPDRQPYAFVKVDTIPNKAWEDSVAASLGIPHRIYEVTNNNYFQSDAVKAIPTSFNTETAKGHVVEMLSPRSKAMFDNDAAFPGLKFEKNTAIDPGFVKDPTKVEDLIAHATMLYTNGAGVNIHVDPDKATNPEYYQLSWEWPLDFFDFRYSNQVLATASTLGYHVGDLYHWYPEEYKKWKEGTPNAAKNIRSLSSALQVYPNPSADNTINLSRVCDVAIFNLNGEKVLTSFNSNVVDISSLSSGIYFVKSSEGYVTKFIKQ